MSSLDILAEQIIVGLRENWSDSDLVRLIVDAIHEFELIESPIHRWDYLVREPQPTGDPGWDAVLAGLAVHMVRLSTLDRTPEWTRDSRRYSPTFRWIGLTPDSKMKAYIFQRTPIYFKSRGVMIDAANLASV